MLYTESSSATAKHEWAWWVGGILAALIIGLAAIIVRKRRQIPKVPAEEENNLRADLMEQMLRMIDEKEMYLRKDLHLEDLAQELATNKTYISLLVNKLSGSKFTDLVNGLRIRHAQQLMKEHPDMLLADIAEASGFSSRSAFFRNFKAQTGLTPMEWLKQQSSPEQ